MSPESHLTSRYDDLADVLYVSTRQERNVEFEPDDDGLVWRFSGTDGSPLGVTVMDYLEEWHSQRDALAKLISKRLRVTLKAAVNALKLADSPADISSKRDAALLVMLKTAPQKRTNSKKPR